MKILYTILFLFLLDVLYAQDWIRYYGQGQNAVCRYITGDYDNGSLISGLANNYRYKWIVKTDVNGDVLWNKRFGNGSYNCWGGNIEKTAGGGSIICGTWQKENPDWDSFIIKLNACAEVEWCRTLSTPDNYDIGLRIKPTPEGDFVLLSYFNNADPYSRTSLFKFSRSGDLIWHQFYPLETTYNNDDARDLLIDNDGYLILTSRYYPDPGTTVPAIERHHFTKTDTAGYINWDLVYGSNDYYYGLPWCLSKSNSGFYYEAGTHLMPILTEAAPAITKLSQNGTPIYNRDIMSGIYWGGLSSIDFLNDSLIVMVGGYSPNIDTSYDVFFKSDTLGNLKTIKILPKLEVGYEDAYRTFDNKFLAVGNDYFNNSWRIVAVKVNSDLEYDSIYTQPFTYDSLCPHPIVSDTIDPNCENVLVSVDEPFKKPESTQLKVYPNPTDNKVTVELPKYLVISDENGKISVTTIYHQWQSATLQAIDLNGKTVLQQEVENKTLTIQVDVSQFPSGTYLFRLLYKGKQVAGSKVLVK